MRNKTREVLELFVETADELEKWEFIEKVKKQGGVFKIFMRQEDDGSWVIEDVGPDDANTRAFLTTFRQFVLKTEPISLYTLHRLSKDPDLSEKWSQEFQKLQKSFLHYMGERERTLPVTTDFPTRSHIMHIFIHGKIFHAKDENKRRIYKKWARYGDEFGLLVIAFNSILYTVYNVITRVARLSEEALAA